MNLIIVESPTKAKTISRFVGKDYIVKSSFGHIRDLPKSELGIDIEDNYKPKYVIPTKARKAVSALKKDAAKADKIILAPDPDREGEAIAWHLVKALGLDEPKTKKEYERIVFHEITKSAVEAALEKPGSINANLVDAQQARRILDRLVGYKLSPFLWKKIARGLSAGRVQSVAVRLIVEREEEIRAFKAEEYWSISGIFESDDKRNLEADLSKIKGKIIDKLEIKNEKEAKDILNNLSNAEYKIASVEKKETNKKPPTPFTTSSLQQAGAYKLGFSAKQTMMLAQQLYQGVEVGGESVGLITYMRTDSMNLSQQSVLAAKDVILSEFGEKYYPGKPTFYKTRSKGAQEAHEAIRPTDPSRAPESVKQYLDPRQYKLYDLIWGRFMASQMRPAVFDRTAIGIETKDKEYTFQANGSVLKFDGFLRVYSISFEDKEIAEFKKDETMTAKEIKPEQHFTKPPARFNEASLIKVLESHGIGRPSTYAPIISTIQDRNYVIKNPSKQLEPTEVGELVNKMLVEHFPRIVDIEFTSEMEESLDDIAEGKKEWEPVMDAFYKPFIENLEKKYEEVSKKEAAEEKTDIKCEKCSSGMIIKMGKYGKFLACSNFPECKNTKPLEKTEEPKPTGIKCEKCGGDMVERKSRYGKFLACSNYPKCKNAKSLNGKKSTKKDTEES